MKVSKPNWFETLNASLDSENLIESWDISYAGISYGSNFSYTWWNENGEEIYVSIFRENDGRYERPIHYATGRKQK